MPVCSFEGGDILRPRRGSFYKACASPCEARAAERHGQEICCKARMPAVAVRKRVDPYEAMMKPDCNLVWRKGVMFDPVAHVVERCAQLGADPVGRDADIAFGRAQRAGPGPDFAEHALVQVQQEWLVQHIAFSREGPQVGFGDADLLGLVQLGARRDVCRNQLPALIRFQRGGCLVAGVEEGIAHSGAQRRLALAIRTASVKRSSSVVRSSLRSAWSSRRMV